MKRILGWPSERVSLQTAAFAVTALSVLILIGIFAFYGIASGNQSTRQVLDERLLLARVSAERADQILEQALLQVQLIVQAETVPREAGTSAEDLCQRLKQQLLPAFPVRFVMFLDPQGHVLWTEPFSITTGMDFSNQDYVISALSQRRATISNSLFDIVPGAVVFLAAPAFGPEGEAIGLVQAGIAPEESDMGDWIDSLAMGETGYGQIVDRNGIVLASTMPEDLFTKAEHGPQFASLIERGTTTMGGCHSCHEAERRKDVLAFAPLASAPWGIAIQQSEEEAFAPVQRLRNNLILIAFAAFAGALMVAWVATKYISEPVRALASASRRIAQGDLSSPARPKGPRELYSLAQDFETMRYSLKESRERMAEWQHELEHTVADRTRNLTSLVRASEALISTLDLELVLKSLLEGAVTSFEVDAGALFLWIPSEGRLRAKASMGYDMDILCKVSLEPGEGIAGKVFSSAEPTWSNDGAQAEMESRNLGEDNRRFLRASRDGRDVCAFLCVPLIFRERILGSLFLAHLREGVFFTPFHVDLASTFARIASALSENIRLLREAGETQALHEADRLKTDFLSNISHDLKTPLATLKASLGFLPATLDGETGSLQASLIDNARRSTSRLERLVDDLIDVARLQNLQLKFNMEPLDLGDVVRRAADSFKPLLDEKGQSLVLCIPAGATLVLGNERRLEQVMDNLIMNAHLYTGASGRIVVTLAQDGNQAVVSVEDNGPGLAQQQKSRVFERFNRGSADGSGLGLGLAIAKGLVELHGGRIWVESDARRGSVFSFSLPLERYDENHDH